jgi:hypothetical protein
LCTPGVSPATADTSAAPFAGDCHAQRAEKQDFDAHQCEHLGSAEHLIARAGGQLRLRLRLRLRRYRLLCRLVGRSRRSGRLERAERRALRERRARHHQQDKGKRERERREQTARGTGTDRRMEREG